MTADPIDDPASFRDPAGRVVRQGPRILRNLTPDGVQLWADLRQNNILEPLINQGRVVKTWETGVAQLEHDPIPFLSYAYEWPCELLRRAAHVHLDLMAELVPKGFILKDATPFNVQFIGCRPVFIDVLSIERRAEGDAWGAYGQFCDTMLYPLMLAAYKNLPHQPWLKHSFDGITPAVMAKALGLSAFVRSGGLRHVLTRAWAHRAFERRDDVKRAEIRAANFPANAILNIVADLKHLIENLPVPKDSAWTGYGDDNSYKPGEMEAKKAFVAQAFTDTKFELVWDIGCNTGAFSEIAAATADTVIAIDDDEAAVGRLATRSLPAILPLVMDWSAPSPSVGWKNEERPGFLARAKPDAVLYLALMHHMAVRRHIPIDAQLALLARTAKSLVVFEYIDQTDPMFSFLTRNIDDSFPDYTRDAFNKALEKYFTVVASRPLSATREIFTLRPRP